MELNAAENEIKLNIREGRLNKTSLFEGESVQLHVQCIFIKLFGSSQEYLKMFLAFIINED